MKHTMFDPTHALKQARAQPRNTTRLLLATMLFAGTTAILAPSLASAQPITLIPAGNATSGSGTALYRHIINSSIALCNDGSPAVAYVQTATNAANVNDWVIAMEGGGSCKNAQECLDRWQGLGGGIQLMSTQISRITWNASRGLGVAAFSPPSGWEAATIGGLPFYVAPARVSRGGMFSNVAANPFAGWNKVFLNYCSRDNHIGRNPLTNNSGISRAGAAVAFNLQFRGADIFDGLIADLRAGFTACAAGPGAACQTMPTLNSATNILLTGSSAGSQGAQDTLDFFRAGQTAVNANTVVRGVFDAGSGPLRNELPYSLALAKFVSYQADMDSEWSMMTTYWDARTDETCFDLNAELRSRCADHMHLQRHHITTSFFFHQDLLDSVAYPKILSRFFPHPVPPVAGAVSYPVGTAAWELSTGSLANLQEISMYREFTSNRYPTERSLIIGDAQWIPSGIFAPRCQAHVTLSNDGFFNQLLPVAGVPTNLATALTTWLATAPGAASTITAYATPGIGPAGGAGVCF